MAKRKVYEVDLISRSVQTKLVVAKSKKEAIEEAENENEWAEKECMLDSDISARIASADSIKYDPYVLDNGSYRPLSKVKL